ncbi:UNVERIFIED_CONTAM: hypothetical protein GTU68_052385, partial [Idotea baltica]|nr:hypothetical protein [Idotea baltica]
MHPDSDYDIAKIRKHPSSKIKLSSESSSTSSASPPVPIVTIPRPTPSPPWETNLQSPPLPPKPEIIINDSIATCATSEVPLKIHTLPQTITSLSETVSDISIVDLTSSKGPSSPVLKTSHFSKPVPEKSNRCRRRGDRAFTCHYCHWSGTDNWCLKRHMNTHIKPFACIMCDYKAARAERLSTHVWKVHNKRICNKCNFLADTQERLLEHTREEHHNNPYSRRHICASCGMSFDTRANLETHIHLAHTRPKSPGDVVQITPIALPEKIQEIAQDLSMKRHFPGEETLSLICPIEECSRPCESSGILADHVRLEHGGLFASRCPHCSYSLTQDELAKDHWLTHHEDVCNACVHVFTSVYGPQLWKKVHVRPQSSESPLNAIVSGLNKKRPDPEPAPMMSPKCEIQSNDSLSLHSFPSSPASESPDNDIERFSKRQRKQSCPKKVVAVASD